MRLAKVAMERHILGLMAGLALTANASAADSYTLDPSHTGGDKVTLNIEVEGFKD